MILKSRSISDSIIIIIINGDTPSLAERKTALYSALEPLNKGYVGGRFYIRYYPNPNPVL